MDGHDLARTGDPATSHAAARGIVNKLAFLHLWAAECVKKSPGRTQRELGREFCPDDPRKIGRRLNECEKLGLVVRKTARRCTISGRMAETWWPPPFPRNTEN